LTDCIALAEGSQSLMSPSAHDCSSTVNDRDMIS